jgi:hypothetical protein
VVPHHLKHGISTASLLEPLADGLVDLIGGSGPVLLLLLLLPLPASVAVICLLQLLPEHMIC